MPSAPQDRPETRLLTAFSAWGTASHGISFQYLMDNDNGCVMRLQHTIQNNKATQMRQTQGVAIAAGIATDPSANCPIHDAWRVTALRRDALVESRLVPV